MGKSKIILEAVMANGISQIRLSEDGDWKDKPEGREIGQLLKEARKKMGITQAELAEKCGTKKSYISKIENNPCDMRMSTILNIVLKGLGGEVKMSLRLPDEDKK